jgi:hypothetical protein
VVSVAVVMAVEALDDVERQAMLLFVPPFFIPFRGTVLASSSALRCVNLRGSASNSGRTHDGLLLVLSLHCMFSFRCFTLSRCFEARGASGSEPCCLPAVPACLPCPRLCCWSVQSPRLRDDAECVADALRPMSGLVVLPLRSLAKTGGWRRAPSTAQRCC